MKIVLMILIFLSTLNASFTADSVSYEEAPLQPYFKKSSFVPTGPYSEDKGYEVYLRLKHDKHLYGSPHFVSYLPPHPLAIKSLQDELNHEIQKYLGFSPSHTGKEHYTVMPEEFFHDLFKIGCHFLHLAGERGKQEASDLIKASEKWFYRAAINGHVYAWYGVGLIWLMNKSEEGNSSASYYLSILAISNFRIPAIISRP